MIHDGQKLAFDITALCKIADAIADQIATTEPTAAVLKYSAEFTEDAMVGPGLRISSSFRGFDVSICYTARLPRPPAG
jgi:hypothetical protein